MATHTTPKNEVCTYSYDLRDRQTLANWNSTTPDTAKTYWANGLLKSIDNGVSKSDYAYNNRNLLTSETQTLAGRPARVVSYDYDADGLRTDLVYPSTRAVEYAWTSRAQLQSVSADGPPPIATYTYDKAGRNTAVAHENGITESKSYDAASQLLANTHLKSDTPVSGHGYTLDATGRRTNETFADGSTPARSYGYDTADQVTAASYGSGQSDTYAYDPMGNRTNASIASQGGGTTTYNANNANQYISVTGLTPISHDANGNLTLQNNVSYAWDSENRLLSVTPNTPALGVKSLVHTYDGQHRRVTRTIREWTSSGWVNTETTHFIYDGWNVIEEYSLTTSGSVIVRNLTWGQDQVGLGGSPGRDLQAAGGVGGLLLVEEINGGTTTAYQFAYDGNGNVTEVTDLNGNSAATYRYDAFGNTLVSTGSYAATNRYRFSTKPLDGEVTNAPLYYYGYRYYDRVTGRWPSRDPIEEMGGINLYGFVGNNPLTLIDLNGLYKTLEEAGKAGATAAADLSRDFDKKFNTKPRPIPWKREYAGLVCKKCDTTTNNEDEFQYTPPHPGLINGPFPKNSAAPKQYDWSPQGAALGPAAASSNPNVDYSNDVNGVIVTCVTALGDGWEEVGYFHSHPHQSGSNPSDKDKNNPKKGRRFLGWDSGAGGSVASEY